MVHTISHPSIQLDYDQDEQPNDPVLNASHQPLLVRFRIHPYSTHMESWTLQQENTINWFGTMSFYVQLWNPLLVPQ
ncbi:hypothetical protein PanWU01x14_103230 [Parasponia andersonii]|uniref:Uncharacterized protein n=1 Tax=Parasponia andersonii TaxID=3476 RepID=A0A2P5D2K5_PARAD|nr:hypothetical protein PanWU01x14_103230 [Parasponia andersonii]